MKIAKPFHNYLNQFVSISDKEFEDYFLPYISIRKFNRKAIVTRTGEVENYMNFIVSGVVRKYYISKDCEINTQISYEGHIIHAQESFHSRTPSEFYIETIEPSIFVSITYDHLEKVYLMNQKMERLGRMVVTYTMVTKDRRQFQMVQLPPRERFINFVNRHPELLQRIPQKHLASFLNIKPETFSRFKHMLQAKNYNEEENLKVGVEDDQEYTKA